MKRTTAGTASRLRFLDNRKPTWRRPDDAVVEEVIIPSLQVADRFDCMVGYFGGAALRELSHGLAAYILRSERPLRLLVSPFLSHSDQESIRLGSRPPTEILDEALDAAFNDETALASALANHTKQCFAYLLATRRLLMKVVMVRGATFHLKEWIFRASQDVVVLSGSANFTGPALLGNVERVNLHRSWRGGDNETACRDVISEFDAYWSNTKPHAIAVDIPIALQQDLLRSYDITQPPTERDYQDALTLEGRLPHCNTVNAIEAAPDTVSFAPPPGLVWEVGPYSHQGTAVLRWEATGRKGILAMATGSGKTITALLCAWRLWRELRSLLIVIATPTRPLVDQWADECREFGLDPYVTRRDSRSKRFRELDLRMQAIDITDGAEVVIVTIDFLHDLEFRELLNSHDGPLILIADEVHNFSGRDFISQESSTADYRLGLSATPEDQYNPERSKRLKSYFGDVVYEFSLDEAIGVCLVPYDYHLHPVHLTAGELHLYRELSAKIARLSAALDKAHSPEKEDRLQLLRNRRRLVLESAAGKLKTLDILLSRTYMSEIRHTLVYATDKDPAQLIAINQLVRDLGIRFHPMTADETQNMKLVDSLLGAFRNGDLPIITAKRVLDEGLDVPEISTAIILASTTVERQWVQRRGRVLRMCPEIDKEYATIHDFLVLPPADEPRDADITHLIKGEIARCEEFTRLARNRASGGGPRDVLQDVRLDYLVPL